MKKLSSTHLKLLLAASLLIFTIVAVSFSGAKDSQAYWKMPTFTPTFTPTATATSTATLTPTPVLEQCQVTGVIFGEEFYFTGDTINITVRVADHEGTPLVGANVAAEVVRQPISIQAATGFGLVDRAGEYDGVYTKTELSGNYQFSFTVSDPTGERFLPCEGSADVEVREIPPTATPTFTVTSTPTLTPTATSTLTPTLEPSPTPTITVTVTTTPTLEPSPTPTITVTATATPTVEPSPTPTVTATITPTLTPSPTPTPTLIPTPMPPTSVFVAPENLKTTLCSLRDTTAINVANVTDLAIVEMEVSYDPDIIQVIDADASKRGVQVRVSSNFATETIFENEVDTRNGLISFGAGVIGVPAINGSSGLIAIDWRPQRVGLSDVTIESITLLDVNGDPITGTVNSGQVEVSFVPNCLSGEVELEGRSEHGDVIVTNAEGQQTVTLADGSFAIAESNSLDFNLPGYLSAQVDLSNTQATGSGGDVNLSTVKLIAGDVNGDNTVNIMDLAYIAQRYLTTDPTADINGDGKVDIMDLVLVAGNYQRYGPIISSQ